MKKGMVCLLLLFTLGAIAQKDSSKIRMIELPDSTAIGTPDGNPISKEIGPGGGSIASEDGRVELIFPAGALSTNTTITIQPATNLAPLGTGKAYSFEPSGIKFKIPVQVIFHYSDEEAKTCSPDLMGFALQNHTGKWEFMDYKEWDSLAKMLKGTIEHFSGFANQNGMQLFPRSQEMRLIDKLCLHLTYRKPKEPGGPLPDVHPVQNEKTIWYVNTEENGGGEFGTIKPFPLEWGGIYAEYYPPQILPNKNPVTIDLVTVVNTSKGVSTRTFTSKIKLYDEYKVLVTDTIEARAGEGTFIADSGSFLVRVSPENIDVTDVRNYIPYSFIKHKPPMGQLGVVIGSDCMGSVHIGRSRPNGQLLSYSHSLTTEENKWRKVLIRFDTQENLGFRYWRKLAGVRIPIEDFPLPSVPELVFFYANGETQIERLGAEDTPYTISVKRTTNSQYIFEQK